MPTTAHLPFISDEVETNESLYIHDIARMMKKNFDRRARGLGLTRAQWMALSVLRRHGGINQVELADRLDVEPMTVARLIDRMEEAGWVERRTDANDRRAKRLYLSARALEITTQLRSLAMGLRNEAMAGVTEDEHKALVNALKKVKNNLCGKAGGSCAG